MKKGKMMADLFIKFCIISFFGCFIECVWHAVLKRELRTKRMLLHLPMCPVYGFGAVLFTTFLDAFNDNFLLVFIYGSLPSYIAAMRANKSPFDKCFSQRPVVMTW